MALRQINARQIDFADRAVLFYIHGNAGAATDQASTEVMRASERSRRGRGEGLRLVHASVPGRVRFRHPDLRGDPGFAATLGARLADHPGIIAASGDPRTGSLLVHYRKPAAIKHVTKAVEGLIAEGKGGHAHPPETRPHKPSTAVTPAPSAGEPVWHAMTASLALDQLQSSAGSGLTAKEAARRLVQTGPNVLTRTEPRSTLAIFADQMTSLPIVLLSASALLSLASGGLIDAAAIMAAVLLNSGIATATESGAERTILGLSRSSCPKGGQQFSSLSLWSPLTSVPAAPPLAPIDPFISESFFVVFDSSV